MFRPQLAVFSLFLLVASVTVFGQTDNDNKCNAKKVAGSYVSLRPNTFSGSGLGVLDQLTLGSDGTASWFQSTAFDLLVTGSTFIPEVGSWQCNQDGTLVVTTIGVNYRYNGSDEVKDKNSRFSQRLLVVDNDTLQTVHRVFKVFDLTSDPLDPNGGTVSSDSTLRFPYKRVKPIPSDVP